MSTKRVIHVQEKDLIIHLIRLAKAEHLISTIPTEVAPYNQQQPESINLSGTDPDEYAGDIIRVEYIDTDNVAVIITLTKDKKGNMLDMDFWKEDFLDLKIYPTPDKVKVIP